MADLADVTQLVMGGDVRLDDLHLTLMGPGLVHVDCQDPDHVFLVTVTQVPRRRPTTSQQVLGEVDGVQVHLVDVTLANHVTVLLRGAGPRAEETSRRFDEDLARWRASATREAPGVPPPWPAEHLAGLVVHLTDDVGTRYEPAFSQGGGADGWTVSQSHSPLPPPDATVLRLSLVHGRTVVGSVEVPLVTAQDG